VYGLVRDGMKAVYADSMYFYTAFMEMQAYSAVKSNLFFVREMIGA
jgi:hypothetical protein